MLERFFKAKSFGLHISNPKHVPGNIFVDVSKMVMYHGYVSWLCLMAIYRGYVSWLCIMAMYRSYVSWICIMAMYHGFVSWLCIICFKLDGKAIWETIAANPSWSIFEKCFKFCFDTGFRIYVKFCEDSPKNR